MGEIRFVCVVTVPRTGCSHTMRLLENCAALNVKNELFQLRVVSHMSGADWAAVKEASGGEVTDDASFCIWRRANPGLALESLYESGGNRVLVFKIAARHLEPGQVEGEILSRGDVAFVILRRRPVEIFISSRKAKVVGTRTRVDTTDITPSLDALQFLRWAKRTKAFFDWFDSAIEKNHRPVTDLLYHRDIEGRSNEDALSRIVGKLGLLGIEGLKFSGEVVGKERQDREPHYRKRIANWSEFESDLMQRSEDPDLLQWALGEDRLPAKAS